MIKMLHHTCRHRNKAGQAIAELVVGIIALVIVFMGMLLVQQMGQMHSQNMMQARLMAGQDALSDQYLCRSGAPEWIRTWQPASGMPTYSAHDVASLGSPVQLADKYIKTAVNPSALNSFLPGSTNVVHFLAAADSSRILGEFYLTHDEETTSMSLENFPFIHWLTGYTDKSIDSIEIKGSAWLTWTHIQ